mmetsp:Transcript_24586/g.48252  ORF Transcript_24586/g.48252 Transcript_24586/m.48252 type:complete len:244 (+) Transcript_24586:231-962(+)
MVLEAAAAEEEEASALTHIFAGATASAPWSLSLVMLSGWFSPPRPLSLSMRSLSLSLSLLSFSFALSRSMSCRLSRSNSIRLSLSFSCFTCLSLSLASRLLNLSRSLRSFSSFAFCLSSFSLCLSASFSLSLSARSLRPDGGRPFASAPPNDLTLYLSLSLFSNILTNGVTKIFRPPSSSFCSTLFGKAPVPSGATASFFLCSSNQPSNVPASDLWRNSWKNPSLSMVPLRGSSLSFAFGSFW